MDDRLARLRELSDEIEQAQRTLDTLREEQRFLDQERRKAHDSRQVAHAERRKLVLALRADGVSPKEIETEGRVPEATVFRYLSEESR